MHCNNGTQPDRPPNTVQRSCSRSRRPQFGHPTNVRPQGAQARARLRHRMVQNATTVVPRRWGAVPRLHWPRSSINRLPRCGWVASSGVDHRQGHAHGELRRRGVSEWVEEMARHVTPDLGVHLRTHSRSLTNPFLLSTVSDRVTPWSVPGVLVIGDAGHTMSPVGAQGINIALRDAVVGSRVSCRRSATATIRSRERTSYTGHASDPAWSWRRAAAGVMLRGV